jgi:cytoskeletal protein CcmA (bactofilin family)
MSALANRFTGTRRSAKHAGPVSEPSEAPSIIAADLTIIGKIHSAGAIEIAGTVEGEIAGRSVTVAPRGHVEGSLAAERISIGGSVKGSVKAITVEVAKTARVVAKITHNTLTIEAGASVEGLRPWRPLSQGN